MSSKGRKRGAGVHRLPTPSPIYAATSTLIDRGLASSRSGSRTVSTPFLYSAPTLPESTVGGSAKVVKSLDERISHQPMIYLLPGAPRGPADQLKAPELVEAAARK